MGKTKIYADGNVKQKAYRERKKELGYRNVLVLVPEHLFLFIKGEPTKLTESFVTLHKDLYIEFNDLAFASENGVDCAILRNREGKELKELKVTDPGKVSRLRRFRGKVRLYVDGTFEDIK